MTIEWQLSEVNTQRNWTAEGENDAWKRVEQRKGGEKHEALYAEGKKKKKKNILTIFVSLFKICNSTD